MLRRLAVLAVTIPTVMLAYNHLPTAAVGVLGLIVTGLAAVVVPSLKETKPESVSEITSQTRSKITSAGTSGRISGSR
jgi:hypothetical protein